MVGSQGSVIRILMSPTFPISKAEALNLAAWLVAIVGDDDAWSEAQESVT